MRVFGIYIQVFILNFQCNRCIIYFFCLIYLYLLYSQESFFKFLIILQNIIYNNSKLRLYLFSIYICCTIVIYRYVICIGIYIYKHNAFMYQIRIFYYYYI